MRAPLAVSASLLLALAVTACSGDGDDSPAQRTTPSSPTASDTAPEVDGEYDQESLSPGASTADFCAALAEIDDAIDDGLEGPGDDQQWQRIVTSLDDLYDVGVPDDLSPAGIAELDQADILVRQSNSVAELEATLDAQPAETPVIEDYIDEHCD